MQLVPMILLSGLAWVLASVWVWDVASASDEASVWVWDVELASDEASAWVWDVASGVVSE
jgi:hypothetical protein